MSLHCRTGEVGPYGELERGQRVSRVLQLGQHERPRVGLGPCPCHFPSFSQWSEQGLTDGLTGPLRKGRSSSVVPVRLGAMTGGYALREHLPRPASASCSGRRDSTSP